MTRVKPIVMPTIFINRYIFDKVNEAYPGDDPIKFFPSTPTAIDDFTEQFPDGNKFYVYDRMLKMRRTPFPHIKEEQMLIYFYARGGNKQEAIADVYENTQEIANLLDRGDESAQEINSWISANLVNSLQTPGAKVLAFGDSINDSDYKEFSPIFFHSFKVFQLEETADIINFGTARTWAGNKLIIDYKYHIPKDFNYYSEES